MHRQNVAILLLLTALILTGCEKAKPANKPIGHHITRLGVRVGSIWGDGYTVDVAPEQYVVVEHRNCPSAKESGHPDIARGLCVIRITKEQSQRFEAAMARFKRTAVPLSTVSVEDWPDRPDGKPCRNSVTDSTLISLTWESTEGAKIAAFYTGCDQQEFENFYSSVLAVTNPLPIKQIIEED